MKKTMLFIWLFLFAATARADSIPLGQICQELKTGALPLAPGVATDLSKNLLDAQAAAYYTAFEPDSLQLSILCVLKAISIYLWDGGPTQITSEAEEPIVWLQSRIAVDTRVGVELDPTFINFGDVPVTTPEPATIILLGLASGYIVLASKRRGISNAL